MDDKLFFNGILADSGEYLLSPIQVDLFARAVAGTVTDAKELDELYQWLSSIRSGPYTIAHGHDPKYLDQAGWGVIFPYGCDSEIVTALRPLLNWRMQQAGKYYREYVGGEGYRPGDSKITWLSRAPRNTGPNAAEPEKIPYYLLIVGKPDQIPFNFQTQLDVQYAVGRICFETVEEYACYARSVVEHEQKQRSIPKRAAFFGVANENDPATQRSCTELVEPLANWFESEHFYDQPRWKITRVFEKDATKTKLGQLLNGSEPPALLFTASHGLGFSPSEPHIQEARQGALLCQDWPGPLKWKNKAIPEDYYFSGDDISSGANIWGTFAFLFACYSAGTPMMDYFLDHPLTVGKQIAARPFAARLPQRMLAHPNGGALAVVGHVDRAWGYSFYWRNAGRQISTFKNTLGRLLDGYPIGYAMEFFNERYAEISSDLTDLIHQDRVMPGYSDPYEMANLWTANNDAKNYVLFGDPAVRLM